MCVIREPSGSRFFTFKVGLFAIAKNQRARRLKLVCVAMKKKMMTLALIVPSLLLLLTTVGLAGASSVVEELEKKGLPGGLLPSSVKSYAIAKDDGAFWVSLDTPCYAQIEDQLAYYGSNITGTIKFGAISNLDGIETKQLFVWLPVTGIYVDVPATPYIYFEVGVLTKRLALAAFETAPKCNPGSHSVEPGLHLSSLAIKGEFGGSRPREAL